MSSDKIPHDKYNQSGCTDTTAYQALLHVRREERRRLITELKTLANRHGYRIVSTIRLKEIGGEDFIKYPPLQSRKNMKKGATQNGT